MALQKNVAYATDWTQTRHAIAFRQNLKVNAALRSKLQNSKEGLQGQ